MVSNEQRRRRLAPEELKAVKERLLQRKKELWQEILEDLENDVIEEHQDLVQTIRDYGDMALEELRESTVFSLIELKQNELEMIEQALGRIEKEEYGRCVDCGSSIRPARLEIMPYAVRCRNCQERWEKVNKI